MKLLSHLMLSHLIAASFAAVVVLSKDGLLFMYPHLPVLTVTGLVGFLLICTFACIILSGGSLRLAARQERQRAARQAQERAS